MLRLLIVDDDPVEGRALASVVEPLGHAVALVANGREALRTLDRRRFDAVLIDLRMLLPDGIAALHEIAGSFASGRAPVLIALLDQAGPGDVPRVLEAGARACLRKPLDGHELTTLLEAMGAAR